MTDRKASLSFSKTFWISNSLTFLERAAFFAIAPFLVIYLNEALGMSPLQASILNGSLLWGLLYFLPLLNSRLAHNLGLKQTLGISFVSISLGYFLMGNLQRLWPLIMGSKSGEFVDYTIPAALSILLIGIGCSLAKSCNSHSIRQTLTARITLGMGIFYLVLHVGSITGRGISYIIRTRGLNLFPFSDGIYLIQVRPAMSNIFSVVATVLSLLGLICVILFFRENKLNSVGKTDTGILQQNRVSQSLAGIFTVLKNRNYLAFLISIGFFWILYAQIFNLIPLYLRFIDPDAPVELYTLINPVVLITLQLLFTRLSRKWTNLKAILIGTAIATMAILINIIPIILSENISRTLSLWKMMLPLAGLFMLLSMAAMTIGEMVLSPRMVDFIGSISPKEKRQFFMGYANLPIACGIIIGSPLGGFLFQHFISLPLKRGDSPQPLFIWLILALSGFISILGLRLFHRFWKKNQHPEIPY
jgi:hypothetical protein